MKVDELERPADLTDAELDAIRYLLRHPESIPARHRPMVPYLSRLIERWRRERPRDMTAAEVQRRIGA
jgi:hypothetical protein